jgi:L-seryl-tRNA(Ser) seleniumtransferase
VSAENAPDSAASGEQSYRVLPSVERVLQQPRVAALIDQLGRGAVLEAVRLELDAARQELRQGNEYSEDQFITAVERRALSTAAPSLVPVINATGVILHTNLGRAPIAEDALQAVAAIASGYSNLEYDVAAGTRGSRDDHCRHELIRLTGAEDAVVVNNNAAAMLLALTALAGGGEVIISRGQLVEVGGGFRIPDVLRQSGAVLVEVGTTNRTYLTDYENAVTERTAGILRVHTSNFRVVGFTHEVELPALAELAHRRNLWVLDDLGSGALADTAVAGLPHEPTPAESIAAGADLVCFSGDKLLGGPQAGLVAGKAALVRQLRAHPLMRALRLDKMTLAALSATLRHYTLGDYASAVPVWRMLTASLSDLAGRAEAVCAAIGAGAAVVEGFSTPGGGSLPDERMQTALVALSSPAVSAAELEARLRRHTPPVIGRIEHDVVLLDLRTVHPRQDQALASAAKSALSVSNL